MKTNKDILAELDIIDKWLLKSVQQRKLKYFGHIKRHDSIEKTILEGHMPGSRSRGRPRRRWSDDIKEWLNMTGAEASYMARDRKSFRMAVMKATSEKG